MGSRKRSNKWVPVPVGPFPGTHLLNTSLSFLLIFAYFRLILLRAWLWVHCGILSARHNMAIDGHICTVQMIGKIIEIIMAIVGPFMGSFLELICFRLVQ